MAGLLRNCSFTSQTLIVFLLDILLISLIIKLNEKYTSVRDVDE